MSLRRWKQLVAGLAALYVVTFAGFEIQHAQETAASTQNANSISQLQANSVVNSALQRQQSLIVTNVLVKFFAMQRFLCEASVAHNKTLGGPPAPPGICDVSFPKPSP